MSDTLEAIWNAYCCRLLAFLRGRVADDAEAEDILQEVFIRVHQHLCCLPQPEKMDGWIYQIARNLVIDHYRKRRELVDLPDDLVVDTEPEQGDSQAALALSLKEMVRELPEPYRQAILLTEYQGLSQVDLAARLGISVSGAKSRVQRARDKLRDMILACCHVEFDRRGKVIDHYARCCCCYPGP
jgi:RNA polymerase sigma-70 factor (ECF subfamily)